MRLFVKICGITSLEVALGCGDLGADAIGFVFARSPRRITPEDAARIALKTRASLRKVGVFVDEEPREILRIASMARLSHLQLHGSESPACCALLRKQGYRVIKAFNVNSKEDLNAIDAYQVDMILLEGRAAGAGSRLDLNLLEGVDLPAPVIIAGGLSAENVGEVIEAVRPFGVDVSSGVELDGQKSLELIKQFTQTVRQMEKKGRFTVNANHMLPDASGYFGPYGGRFVPETLMPALEELQQAYDSASRDPAFLQELDQYLRQYSGRPTPLFHAKRLSKSLGNLRVYLKREDLNHTGAHKINNALGQGLLAKRMGKTRVIAETGAGQHGVATATVAALLDLECRVYMGQEDMRRQSPNVYRMEALGAEVQPVTTGKATLKEATGEAIRDWVTNVRNTHYIIGSVVGPHPYPAMVRDFQTVIGREAREQFLRAEGRLPDYLVACVGGGSNAMGLFWPFLNDRVKMIGVEAAGHGMNTPLHAATLNSGIPGILHGSLSYLLQDENGQTQQAHSISAGLDYPGVGPEHSYLKDAGRVRYVTATDEQAVAAFLALCRSEGIIPALESAHAVAFLGELAREVQDASVVVCLSGRGDKDIGVVSEFLEIGAGA